MKHILSIVAAMALLWQATALVAQDSGGPSEQSVLEKARQKYQSDQGSEQAAPEPAAEAPAAAEAQASPSPATDEKKAEEEPEIESKASYTPFQISAVPGLAFPMGYYDVSIAVSPIGNLTRDVAGLEAAGIMNIARDIRGVQSAGIMNNSRNVQGLQGAGIFNISRDIRGLQGAGIFNMAGKVEGIQAAGIFNMADGSIRGLQGAGIFNQASSQLQGVQAAGIANISTDMSGVQGAGIFNISQDIIGLQAAGIFNIATDVNGVQAAGIFNVGRNVRGIQIGLVNVADSINGPQIGLVNIAGNGVDSIGLLYEPVSSYVYTQLQLGSPFLYSVATVGAPAGDWFIDGSRFLASLGLGTRAKLWFLDLDFDVSMVQAIGALPYESFNPHRYWDWSGWSQFAPFTSARLSLGLPLGRHFRIVGGLKADFDFDGLGYRVPDELKKGRPWRAQTDAWGFTAWPKWFFGVKL
jgi:hypothetical protein